MATKTAPQVPEIRGLLSQISAKRAELPKSPIQEVRPVAPLEDSEEYSSKNVNTLKRKNTKSPKVSEKVSSIGRPSLKDESIAYVKLGAKIPEYLRVKSRDAINHKKFRDSEGRLITTLDELVTHALETLLKPKS